MEVKRLGAGGGIDLDSEPFLVSTNDGRERSNVRISETGVITTAVDFDYDSIPGVSLVATDGEDVYVLAKNGSDYNLYKYSNGVKSTVFSTQVPLFHDSSKAMMNCSNGKLLITEPGYDAVYIDVANIMSVPDEETAGMSLDTDGYVVVELNGSPVVGGYVTFYSVPNYINRKKAPIDFCGKAKVLSKTLISGDLWRVKVDINRKYFHNGTLSSNTTCYDSAIDLKQVLSEPYIKLSRPVPQLAPYVVMEYDASIPNNNFIDNVFSYGYTFVYYDGYETPLSPMTELNIEAVRAKYLGYNLNKAVLSARPYAGVEYVRFYCKRNNPGNDLELIAEKPAMALTLCEFDGVSTIGVLDNTRFVKSCENIPLSPEVGKFIENRIVLGGAVTGYSNGDVSFEASFDETYKNIPLSETSSTPTISVVYESNIYGTLDGLRITLTNSFPFDPTTCDGWHGLIGSARIFYQGSDDDDENIYLTVSGYTYFDKQSQTIVRQNLVSGLTVTARCSEVGNINNEQIIVSSDGSGNIVIRVAVRDGFVYTADSILNSLSFKYRKGGIIYDKTLKLNETYEFGVQFFDEFGRTGGVYTSATQNMVAPTLAYSEESIQIVTPKLYLSSYPSWARYYQFAVKRRILSNKQHFIPGKNTTGAWGTTNLAYKVNNGRSYVSLNLMFNEQADKTASLIYTLTPGDYIRLWRIYTTSDKLVNVSVNETRGRWVKVEDVAVESGIEYFILSEDLGITSEWEGAKFLQFEVKNASSEVGREGWLLIGDRYNISELGDYASGHQIEYGDYLTRITTGLYSKAYVSGWLHLESPFIDDRDLKKYLFGTNRITLNQKYNPFTETIRLYASNPMISGTFSNNLLVFESSEVQDISATYGKLTGIESLGRRAIVFLERAIYLLNVGQVEVSLAEGMQALYSQAFFGGGRYILNSGCSNHRTIANTGDVIYYYDENRKAVMVLSDNGIYDISGVSLHVNGKSNGLVKSVFDTGAVASVYDSYNKKLYVSRIDDCFVFDDVNNRWEQLRLLAFSRGVYLKGLWLVNEEGSVLLKPGSSINALDIGEAVLVTGRYDMFLSVLEDVDFLSLVSYSDFKPYIRLFVYGENGLLFKSEVRPDHWEKLSDGYYCDIPKGALAGETLRTHHLFEGYDLVGKTLQAIVYVDVGKKFYGLEVRYEKRNY